MLLDPGARPLWSCYMEEEINPNYLESMCCLTKSTLELTILLTAYKWNIHVLTVSLLNFKCLLLEWLFGRKSCRGNSKSLLPCGHPSIVAYERDNSVLSYAEVVYGILLRMVVTVLWFFYYAEETVVNMLIYLQFLVFLVLTLLPVWFHWTLINTVLTLVSC